MIFKQAKNILEFKQPLICETKKEVRKLVDLNPTFLSFFQLSSFKFTEAFNFFDYFNNVKSYITKKEIKFTSEISIKFDCN